MTYVPFVVKLLQEIKFLGKVEEKEKSLRPDIYDIKELLKEFRQINIGCRDGNL